MSESPAEVAYADLRSGTAIRARFHGEFHARRRPRFDTLSDTLRSGHGCDFRTRLDREFANSLSKTADLDTSERGWTAHDVIRNQQVSGSSPLAGSNRINNLQRFAAGRNWAVSTPCPAVSALRRLHHAPGQTAGEWPVEARHQARTGCFRWPLRGTFGSDVSRSSGRGALGFAGVGAPQSRASGRTGRPGNAGAAADSLASTAVSSAVFRGLNASIMSMFGLVALTGVVVIRQSDHGRLHQPGAGRARRRRALAAERGAATLQRGTQGWIGRSELSRSGLSAPCSSRRRSPDQEPRRRPPVARAEEGTTAARS